jgi:hypothetical protein
VNTAKNRRVPKNAANILTSYGIVSISRRSLLYGFGQFRLALELESKNKYRLYFWDILTDCSLKLPTHIYVGAEVKFRWGYLDTPPHTLMTCCLIKHRYSFIFQLSLFYLPIFLLCIFTSSLNSGNCTLARISDTFAHSPSPVSPSPLS